MEFSETDVHGHNSVAIVLEVESHLTDISAGQGDARQIYSITGQFFLQGCLETVRENERNKT